MPEDIKDYHSKLEESDSAICEKLNKVINENLKFTENKVWHAHPVWFIDGNPIVGYSKEKPGIRLMFWSGKNFNEEGLNVVGKNFKDASVFYNSADEINIENLKNWLKKSENIQWNYKDIRKNKGILERLK